MHSITATTGPYRPRAGWSPRTSLRAPPLRRHRRVRVPHCLSLWPIQSPSLLSDAATPHSPECPLGEADRTAAAAEMPPALRCVLALVALALSSVLLPLSIVADRFSPAITPTHLTSVNGISRNAMLITRTSIPPGMDPADVTLTAEQLADENAAWACISPTAAPGNTMPLAFIVTRVAEIALANLDWAQSSPPFFALRYFNGSVQVYQATGTVTTNGVAEFSAPYWLSGVYSEMTTGEAHICALTTDQRVQCITTTLSFPAPTALMATRSAVAYTQIAAASRFTCGLRALDQLVECCGAVGRDVNALTAVNYTSTSVALHSAARVARHRKQYAY